MEQNEVKSDNARNVILSYQNQIYYVNSVNVKVQEGEQKIQAVFHAKRASDNAQQDLDLEITQGTYDILMEYAKLDKLDLIMVLQVDGADMKWCLMSEDWLQNQLHHPARATYIV
jgi:hypothetical protein